MRGERQDIVATLAQRRELNRENGHAIVKILAKVASIDRFLQVAICCGDDTNVDPAAANVADAFQFLLL